MSDRQTSRPNFEQILAALRRSWSSDSCSLWAPETLARGQCNVTALVIQDTFGGQILKTSVGGAWHFYNRIGDQVVDFTAEQFAVLPAYLDLPATREEAMAGAAPEQYRSLSKAFRLQVKPLL